MDTKAYSAAFPELKLCKIPPDWLSSMAAYNRMKCSIEFYELFKDYNYMLTYELDSYIFSDDWHKANVFDYDFIGAPWFQGYSEAGNEAKIIDGRNSGFSIRNLRSCIRILEEINKIKPLWSLFNKIYLHKFIRLTFILRLFNSQWNFRGKNVYFFGLTTDGYINEDAFWSVAVPQIFKFKTAPEKDAIKFSFEVNPSRLFDLNDQKLPIGCHAWERYDCKFWGRYIQ